jgi:PPM family protein phosphatase
MFIYAHAVAAYRPLLEDRVAVIERPGSLVVVVADGAGGRMGGAAAAEGAVQGVREAAAMEPLARTGDWVQLLRSIDADLVADPEAGETTLVGLTLSAAGIVGASVGDSGAWVVDTAGWRDLTARQQRKPDAGTGMAAAVPFQCGPLEGTLLLATDGLLKYAVPERIAPVARGADLQAAAAQVVELVRLPSGELWDDVGVVLCRLTGRGGTG